MSRPESFDFKILFPAGEVPEPIEQTTPDGRKVWAYAPEVLVYLWTKGMKLAPTFSNSIAFNYEGLCTEEEFAQYPGCTKVIHLIYRNPDFWAIERFYKESWRFEGVRCLPGKTYIRDKQGNKIGKARRLFILDIDSEKIYKKCNNDLINEWMQCTYVTKSLKQFGYHVYWFEDWKEADGEDDFVNIDHNDCKSEALFEILVGVDYCQVLGQHRDPSSRPDFRYGNAGCKGLKEFEIMYRNGMYNQQLENFKDTLDLDQINKRRKLQQKSKDPFHQHANANGSKDVNLDPSLLGSLTLALHQIHAIVDWVQHFYEPSKRYHFMRPFIGVLVRSGCNEESVTKIIDKICSDTGDLSGGNREKWYGLLQDAYQRIRDDLRVEGKPTLSRTLCSNFGLDEKDATEQVTILSAMIRWQPTNDDQKGRQEQQDQQQQQQQERRPISVSEAIRLTEEGPLNVAGKIVGISSVQDMYSKIYVQCDECGFVPAPYDYTHKPVWKSPVKDPTKSSCGCSGLTAVITDYKYVASLEIQIQDLDKIDNIEHFTALLFNEDTKGLQFNDIVDLKGHLYIVRKYDNPRNKLEPVLFVHSLEKRSKGEQIKNTEADIEEFKQFASKYARKTNEEVEENCSLIDELVAITAPHIFDNELAKKAGLIVAVNAGLENDDTRLPKRIRSHMGLIGDPGQGKSQMLYALCDLVPGSRVESMQSGTPISMTVYVDKSENGQRSCYPGPVVQASDGILGLNEMGQIKNIEDNKYFTDAAEEGQFTVNKHGINIHQVAHPSFIWNANPISGRWKNPDVIDAAEFPIIAQWADRMDFIIPYVEDPSESWIRKYGNKRRELKKKLGTFAPTTLWLKKYLLYARSLKPEIPDEMSIKLEDYLVAIANHGVRGLPRKLDALERTAIGFAKINLKEVVDEEDVSETINLFNDILKFYRQETVNLRDTTFLKCLNILEKTSPDIWKRDNVVQKVCSEDPSIDLYIGKVKNWRNYKVKDLTPLFDKHPNLQKICEKPASYYWVNKDDRLETIAFRQESSQTEKKDEEIIPKKITEVTPIRVLGNLSDESEVSAKHFETCRLENLKLKNLKQDEKSVADIADSADGFHKILTEQFSDTVPTPSARHVKSLDSGNGKSAMPIVHTTQKQLQQNQQEQNREEAEHSGSISNDGYGQKDEQKDQISLTHSPGDIILTNDDYEDVEIGINTNTSSNTAAGSNNEGA